MRDLVWARRAMNGLARRSANQGPDKLRSPRAHRRPRCRRWRVLSAGGRGRKWPKGSIRRHVGSGWCIVAEPGVIDASTAITGRLWKAIGGRIAIVAGPQTPGALEDADGTTPLVRRPFVFSRGDTPGLVRLTVRHAMAVNWRIARPAPGSPHRRAVRASA